MVAGSFSTLAVINPGVRILMHEEGHPDSGEVCVAFVAIAIAPQSGPGVRRDAMRRRADGQEIENSVFAEGVPARFKKACFRFPAVRKKKRFTVQHPAKVDPIVDLSSQLVDFAIVAKVLTRR